MGGLSGPANGTVMSKMCSEIYVNVRKREQVRRTPLRPLRNTKAAKGKLRYMPIGGTRNHYTAVNNLYP